MPFMELFFTYEDNLPPGTGYVLFGKEHICILIFSLCLTVGCICLYDKGNTAFEGCMRKCVAAALVVLIALRQAYVCLVGANIVYDLPLHLCSIAGIVCFIYEYTGSVIHERIKSVLEQALFALCLPGAVLAIVFSDGIMYPVFHFVTIESGLFHVFIIVYVIFKIKDGDIKPGIREAYKSGIFLVIVAIPVYLFDRAFRANYMFLMGPSQGSPLTGLYTGYGYEIYMIGYGLLAMAEVLIINGIGSIIVKRMITPKRIDQQPGVKSYNTPKQL